MTKRIRIILILWLIFAGAILKPGFIPPTGIKGEIQPDLGIPINTSSTSVFDLAYSLTPSLESKQTHLALQSFAATVTDGNSGAIRGVYSDNVLAFPVIQQPQDQPGFVSSIDGIVTQFSLAAANGVVGLLAHNYLSGRHFYGIEIGSEIQIVYGDGEIQSYLVNEIQKYQALQPKSQHSRFVDITSGEELSASELFKRVYLGENHLTLQTCIEQDQVDSWGRMFIIANPI